MVVVGVGWGRGGGGGGGSSISEVKLPVFVKFTAFCFVNKLTGRV